MQLVFFLFQCICFDQYDVKASWVPLNPLYMPSTATFSVNLQTIQLGKSGRRMAVGLSNNSITIYDLVTIPANNDKNLTAWIFAANLNGISGVHFSLSPDGQFLASRHHSIAKQVQVWEIISSKNHDEDSEEEHSSQGVIKSKLRRSTERFEMLGTFWCVADGQTVKLGQTRSKLFLAMSCETWSSNRGMVQVFVRDLSEPSNNSAAWDDSFPSLEGSNDGDLFGTALSIAEAPSHYSDYEFRLAISSPGYNYDQGLVRIYTASYANSSGWGQMGGDLTGSKIGERFGATIDMSGNINDQPFVIVGSPGWKGTADYLNLTNTGDFVSDEESLGSLGTGLVRLYHWRKSDFSFRAPHRWTLVGEPMPGRNIGDQFGSTVAISRTGERIVIAASLIKSSNENSNEVDHCGGYIGIYERESFHSWGKVVNDVITYSGFPCDDINQCLSSNDNGSMITTALSNGTVRAFIDDSPFCSSSTTEKAQTNVNDDISSILLNFEMLLDRQTCRKSDALVETRKSCLQQSVYMRGEYRACFWQNTSITHVPPMFPSVTVPTSPKEKISSFVPSLSPSFSSPVAVPGSLSMMPWEPISLESSLEPSLAPKFSTAPSPVPSYRPLQDPADKIGEPLVVSDNEKQSPTSMSALPTSTVPRKSPFGPNSPQPSLSQSIDTSLSPTGRPPNRIGGDEGIADQVATRHFSTAGMVAFISLVFVLVFCCSFGKRQFRRR